MSLPAPAANTEWAQSGGSATKSVGQLALGAALARAFTVQAGRGSRLTRAARRRADRRQWPRLHHRLPGTVRAFDASTGAQTWASQTPDKRGRRSFALRRRHRL